MDIQIRYIEEKDAAKVAELEKKYFSLPWSYDSIIKEVNNKASIFGVAVYREKVVGYGGMMLAGIEGYITNIVVDEKYRRNGIGKKIVQFLLEEGTKKNIEDFTLEVRVSNKEAISLYEGLGFVSEGVRPRFYEKPIEDAMIMWKRLQEKC